MLYPIFWIILGHDAVKILYLFKKLQILLILTEGYFHCLSIYPNKS